MGSYARKLLAQKIRAQGVSYLTIPEIDDVVAALRAHGDLDLANAIDNDGIMVVDKGDAWTVLAALES
jgi:hypothetical protein